MEVAVFVACFSAEASVEKGQVKTDGSVNGVVKKVTSDPKGLTGPDL
jgi:hypothetical protein